MVITMATFAAVWVATQQAEVLRDCVFNVLRGRGYTDEQIADLFDIGRGQLADQKALRGHLSMWRFANLPAPFQREILSAYMRTLGMTVLDDAAYAEFVQEGRQYFKRRQLKMALAIERRKVSA